ncbi:MAG: hypothetical protein ACTSVI_09440 [Promethearchaeota archaeon]
MSSKRKEVYSHPTVVKLLGIFTTLFMLGTFGINGIVMASGAMIDWGFYPNKLQPSIKTNFNNATLELSLYIPVYINNTGMIGFDVQDLTIDFDIYNSTNKIASEQNNIGNVPHGTSKIFNVTMIKENALALMTELNGSTSIRFEIMFHMKYIFTAVNLNLSIEFPGGLSI